jgi:hypothetical protein
MLKLFPSKQFHLLLQIKSLLFSQGVGAYEIMNLIYCHVLSDYRRVLD